MKCVRNYAVKYKIQYIKKMVPFGFPKRHHFVLSYPSKRQASTTSIRVIGAEDVGSCHTHPNDRLLQLLLRILCFRHQGCCHTHPNDRLLQRAMLVSSQLMEFRCHTHPNDRLLQRIAHSSPWSEYLLSYPSK